MSASARRAPLPLLTMVFLVAISIVLLRLFEEPSRRIVRDRLSSLFPLRGGIAPLLRRFALSGRTALEKGGKRWT